MEFKTSISKITNEDVVIRENKLSDLMKECSFSDGIFLILKGSRPTEKESNFRPSALRAIGTVNHVAAPIGSKIFPNGVLGRLSVIGRAHDFPILGNGIFAFENHDDNRSR